MSWRHDVRVDLVTALAATMAVGACADVPWRSDGTQRELPEARENRDDGTRLAAARDAAADAERAAAPPIEEAIAALEPTSGPRGLTVTLAGVFAANSATLRPDARGEVEALAALLRQHPGREVLIEGHTDDTGDAMINLHFSLERAGAVKSALVAEGIAPERLGVSGRGERVPIAPNDTEEGRRRNRRVEVIVLDAGDAAPVPPDVASGR